MPRSDEGDDQCNQRDDRDDDDRCRPADELTCDENERNSNRRADRSIEKHPVVAPVRLEGEDSIKDELAECHMRHGEHGNSE